MRFAHGQKLDMAYMDGTDKAARFHAAILKALSHLKP